MFDGDYEYRKLPLISSELWFYIFSQKHWSYIPSQGVLGGLINGGAVSEGDYEYRKLPLINPGLILSSQGVLGGFINGGAVSEGDYE